MNYGSVRISKQSNNYCNYSCKHLSKRGKQEFELLLPCLPILTDPSFIVLRLKHTLRIKIHPS